VEHNRCRICGSEGWKVLPITLGNHLKEEYWGLIDSDFHFCPSPECDVVYFNNVSGVYFRKSELRRRVGIKEKDEPKPVCYCNRVTERDLLAALRESGSFEKALEITGAGKGGWCIITNPSGRCCEWHLRNYGEVGKRGKEVKS